MTRLRRMWINAPSTLQKDHAYHGKNVFVDEFQPGTRKFTQAWFAEPGPLVSTTVEVLTLSDGWRPAPGDR